MRNKPAATGKFRAVCPSHDHLPELTRCLIKSLVLCLLPGRAAGSFAIEAKRSSAPLTRRDQLTTSTIALRDELLAASPQLVDNADLLRGVLAGCGDCIKILDLDGRLQFMSEGG